MYWGIELSEEKVENNNYPKPNQTFGWELVALHTTLFMFRNFSSMLGFSVEF
jgi:hypothetical protein